MERREELQLRLEDARVDYAEALSRIVQTKRLLAYLAIKGTNTQETTDDEYSYGEHELNIERGRE